jgi:DNA-binding transcriptional MocR family regulator
MATISFARGVPSPDLLPVDVFGEATRAAVERDGRTILNYGPPGGYPPLREWIAERHGADPARVVVTNGSLQGFHFVMRHLLAEGGRALVEAPSYDRTLLALRKLGADVEAIPMREDGLDVEVLRRALDRAPATILYTIPTFQNPSGRTLSRKSREALAELLVERDLLVYEDDPYGGVRFEGEALPTLYELTGGRNIVHSSSFSKVVAPGIRVGYAVLPEPLVKPIEAAATETYISPSIFVQGALHEFLTAGGYEAALERVRAGLRERRDSMLEALEREFPEGSAWSRPEGGYFLWLDLPAGVETDWVFARAAEAGVAFVKGSDFFLDGAGRESARLAFSFPSPGEIRDGIARLGGLVRESAAVAV